MQPHTNFDGWYQAKPTRVEEGAMWLQIDTRTNGNVAFVEMQFGNYLTENSFCVKIILLAKHYDDAIRATQRAARNVMSAFFVFLTDLEVPFTILSCERMTNTGSCQQERP